MSDYKGNPNLAGLVTSTEIPDDGKKLKASDVNVPLEAAFDNFAYLKGRGFVASSAFVWDSEAFPGNAWQVESFTTSAYVDAANVHLDAGAVEVGDVVHIDFSAFVAALVMNTHGPEWGSLRLRATQNYGAGGAITSAVPGGRLFLPGHFTFAGDPAGSGRIQGTFALSCRLAVTLAGPLRITLQGKTGPTAGGFVQIISTATLRVAVFRAF